MNFTKLVKRAVCTGIAALFLFSTAAMAASGPVYIIGTHAYNSSDFGTHPSLETQFLQDVNTQGLANLIIDTGSGVAANYNAFMATDAAHNLGYNDLVAYAQAHAATIPTGTMTQNADGTTTAYPYANQATTPAALAISSATALNCSQIKVTFNEAVNQTAAETTGYYTITDNNGATVAIANAALQSDGTSVILTTGAAGVPTALSTTKTYTVSVANDVSTSAATALTTALSKGSITMSDTTLPAITSVTPYGNTKIIVTFNKPVKFRAASFAVQASDGTYTNGDDYGKVGFAAETYVAGSGYTQVELDNTTTVIPSGSYNLRTIGGAADVRDAQGLNLITTVNSFNVTATTTVATASTLTVVNRTTVDVAFSSSVQLPGTGVGLYFGTAGTAATVAYKTGSQSILEYTFTTNVIPTGSQTFTVSGVTDSYGNTVPTTTFTKTVSTDSVATATVSSSATNAIKVTFSKDMLNDGSANAVTTKANYTVKDSNGNTITLTSVTYSNANSTYVATLNGTIAPGTYTVSVSGINDLVGQAMTAVSNASVTVPDTIAPTYAGITVAGSGNVFVITYNKAMATSGAHSITSASNYEYYNFATTTWEALPTGTTLVASSDGTSVTVTLPGSVTATPGSDKVEIGTVTASTVYMVSDAAGNLLDTLPGLATTDKTIVTDTAPTFAAGTASVTGAHTIKVSLSAGTLATISPSDLVYTISGGAPTTTPLTATLSTVSGTQYITITTATADVITAATSLANIKVGTVAAPSTSSEDALGTKITASLSKTASATSMAASIAAVEIQDSTNVMVYLNGVATALTAADFTLYQNGTSLGAPTGAPTLIASNSTGSIFKMTFTGPIDTTTSVTLKTVSQDLVVSTDTNSNPLTANTTGVTGSTALMANSVAISTAASTTPIVTGATLTIVFNRALDTTTVVSGWNGTGTQAIDVPVTTAGLMTIPGVGTISGFTNSGVADDFNTSTVGYTAATRTLTITLNDAGTIHTGTPAAHGLTFTPASTLKSTAGLSESSMLVINN